MSSTVQQLSGITRTNLPLIRAPAKSWQVGGGAYAKPTDGRLLGTIASRDKHSSAPAGLLKAGRRGDAGRWCARAGRVTLPPECPRW
jgi:hypothetical protein